MSLIHLISTYICQIDSVISGMIQINSFVYRLWSQKHTVSLHAASRCWSEEKLCLERNPHLKMRINLGFLFIFRNVLVQSPCGATVFQFEPQEVVTTATSTTQAALSPDKAVKCHCVLVPVSSLQELKIDQLRERAVIKPSPPL